MVDTATQHRPAPIEAYLSSTLAHEHDIARKALEGCVIRERPRDIDAIGSHLEEVARSRVYVGIVGWTRGHVPRGSRASMAELEYERARASGLLRLLFLKGPVTGAVESSELERVVAFRRHLLRAGDTTAVFTNDSELRDSLWRSIANLRSTRDASPILNGDDIRIFVSYRRTDSQVITGRLCDRLKSEFGSDRVFVDIDNVPVGDDFVEHIRARLKQCQIVLAVIGTKWRGRRRGASRLDEANDFVRMELSVALADSIRIVPILIDGARMPAPADLPEDIRRLSTLNAATLSTGKDFHHHAAAIIAAVRRLSVEGAERRFWAEAAMAASSGPRAAAEGFSVSYFSRDVQYQCRSCGFTHWIDKLEWGRDGERPPVRCPQCGGQGYSE